MINNIGCACLSLFSIRHVIGSKQHGYDLTTCSRRVCVCVCSYRSELVISEQVKPHEHISLGATRNSRQVKVWRSLTRQHYANYLLFTWREREREREVSILTSRFGKEEIRKWKGKRWWNAQTDWQTVRQNKKQLGEKNLSRWRKLHTLEEEERESTWTKKEWIKILHK